MNRKQIKALFSENFYEFTDGTGWSVKFEFLNFTKAIFIVKIEFFLKKNKNKIMYSDDLRQEHYLPLNMLSILIEQVGIIGENYNYDVRYINGTYGNISFEFKKIVE